jgi:tetraacyldisaccharide 4'-kinase
MIDFFEKLYYSPKWYHFLVGVVLLPISAIYALVGALKSVTSKEVDYSIKIISIGNLTVGGSGKTPFAIELINHLNTKYSAKIFYISRGYGRQSSGLVVVKNSNKILASVEQSGDEAMLVAKECSCGVIVSEDRVKAINLAKSYGANLIILDDAFSKVNIKKFDILLEPANLPNRLVLPSGPFREIASAKSRANLILKEGKDFKRVVNFSNLSDNMLLVTAIANPSRLKEFLPKGVVGSFVFKDHDYFNRDKIIEKMQEVNAKTILVTQKDMVKLENFNLPISVMKLRLDINIKAIKQIEEYYEEQNRDS